MRKVGCLARQAHVHADPTIFVFGGHALDVKIAGSGGPAHKPEVDVLADARRDGNPAAKRKEGPRPAHRKAMRGPGEVQRVGLGFESI